MLKFIIGYTVRYVFVTTIFIYQIYKSFKTFHIGNETLNIYQIGILMGFGHATGMIFFRRLQELIFKVKSPLKMDLSIMATSIFLLISTSLMYQLGINTMVIMFLYTFLPPFIYEWYHQKRSGYV